MKSREEVRSLLKKLVRIRSPSGKEEKIREFLKDYLSDLGLKPREVDGNLVVERGGVFVGTHMDTVTVKREYSEGPKEAYGTGVCDAKGCIASILLAVSDLEELNYSLVFFHNEEEGGTGSLSFSRTFKPGVAIVMEPTELKVATRHYGSMEVDFKIKGESFHGAFPNLGISAIDRFIKFYEKVRSICSSSYVRKVSGGSDEYVIPGRCNGIIEMIFPPEIKKEYLKSSILEISKPLGINVSFKDEYDGFELEGRAFSLISEALRRAGEEVKRAEMPSWTDAINLYQRGWDVTVWGPGSLPKCHTAEERISFEEIERARRVLVNLNSLLE